MNMNNELQIDNVALLAVKKQSELAEQLYDDEPQN